MSFLIRTIIEKELGRVGDLCFFLSKEIAPNRRSNISELNFVNAVGSFLLNGGKILVALDCDAQLVVGFMALEPRCAILAGGSYVEISELYIVPEIRNRKVGSMLIEHAKMYCSEQGIKRLTLYTGESELTRSPNTLYVRHGFEFVGPSFRCLL